MSNLLSIFDSMMPGVVRGVRAPWFFNEGYHRRAPEVRVDETAYIFEMDVPGVEKEDLRIELNDDVLTVQTVHAEASADESDKSDAGSDAIKQADSARSYRFGFRVPDDIDAEQMKASLKNGVLTVTLPKNEEKLPKKIPVIIE